jgi:cation diffusion facilitator CzcD-associated flavoprotein CzcO
MGEAEGHLHTGARPNGESVAIVGAGQAGLAMGYFLRQSGIPFVIFERADSIGPAWRERWDSLTLFTPRRYSGLPGLPFPGDPEGYPTRDEVIDYLERYADTFELPVEMNSEVRELRGEEGRFVLDIGGQTKPADQVVVATGSFQTPYIPDLAGHLSPQVFQTHAVGYRRPSDLPQGTALVVGGGNTGFQIAKEVSATHKVVLSVGFSAKAASPAARRSRPLLVADQDTPPLDDRRVATRQPAPPSRAVDRLKPTRVEATPQGRAQTAGRRSLRTSSPFRRRERD